ncbi:hypothetical protein [Streptomyces sp. DH37]|uniref:hypothetical protein n=1 Tax=Streptomyces sp. DH37 TaxID=3040122 RepID=UPI0024419351|nr:hypothetical protein [Streptomyces sp. DH37]MDG9701540.1 hypothetical protein [Streptomyces sp. DH37]
MPVHVTPTASELLLTGMFGEPLGIARDVAAFYGGVEAALEEHTGVRLPDPAARPSLAAPGIRRAVVHRAHQLLSRGDVEGATRGMRSGYDLLSSVPPQDHVAADAPVADGRPYLLASLWQRHAAGRHLLEAARRDLPAAYRFVDADASHASRVGEGLRSLYDTVGELGASVVRSVHGAMLISSESVVSAFVVPMPYVSVISADHLDDPVATADMVFHEACHQKYYDLLVCRRIADPSYDYTAGPVFGIPWTLIDGRRRDMDALRVVSTLHVYCHLLELFTRLESRGHTGAAERLDEYWRRARFFARLTESRAFRASLGPDGHAMARWLNDVMALHDRAVRDLGHHDPGNYLRDAQEQVERVDALGAKERVG